MEKRETGTPFLLSALIRDTNVNAGLAFINQKNFSFGKFYLEAAKCYYGEGKLPQEYQQQLDICNQNQVTVVIKI